MNLYDNSNNYYMNELDRRIFFAKNRSTFGPKIMK